MGLRRKKLEVTLDPWRCKGGSGGPGEGPSATSGELPRRGPELGAAGSPKTPGSKHPV